ncbi:MAG: hypothetical protein Q8K98_11990 [Bacteroidota bacterium]|nr:hypothetical protein [Bacteroidota bacterium]
MIKKSVILFMLILPGYCFSSASQDDNDKETKTFQFPHDLNRIFATPTADVLKSLDLNIILGGAFGFEESSAFLGNVALGLGGIADIEVNTGSLLGALANVNQNIPTITLKGKIYKGTENYPAIAVGLRSSNDWDRTKIYESGIRASEPELYNEGLRNVDYEARITTAFIAFSKNANENLSMHAGGGISDLRYRNIRLGWAYMYEYTDDGAINKKQLVYVFGGLIYTINERTQFMFEAQTMPYFNVNTKNRTIVPKQRGLMVVGIRSAVSKVLLFDTGIRYQSNYKGIADTQIRLSLSFFISLPS